MKKPILLLLPFLFLTTVIVRSQTIASYEWSQVKIGGGGYITGMKIHPLNGDIQYFRTDVGGAYRWNAAENKMDQIINFPSSKKSYYGVAGIALHPSNQNNIYLAVDQSNTTTTSKILYSTDRGDNWQEITVPNGVKFGANGGRTGTSSNDTDREGTPIAVNPQNTNELWVGTRGLGVWILDLTKSVNAQWRRVPDIPDYDLEGSIRSIQFNPNNTDQIFVGYATKGIYRSSDAGQSFELINNGNSDLSLVADMSFSMSGDKIFVAVKNQGIYRLNNPSASVNWEKLNVPFSNIFRGYQTVTTSPHSNDIVMASVAAAGGNNLERLQVSFDGGNTWTTKSETTITNTFTWKDISNGVGTHTSQIVFDPNDANKLYCTTWFGMWHTDDWQQSTIAWKNVRAKGHEEIVPSGLYAFPPNTSQNKVGVNSADYVAVISKDTDSYDITDVRTLMDDSSKVIKGIDITACENYPNNFILSSTDKWEPSATEPNYGALLYTSDGGNSYERLTNFDRNWGRSLVAIAANDPSNFVVAHGGQIHYTRNKGTSFNLANITELGNVVENNVFARHMPLTQDFVSGNTFYLYDRTNGALYSSVNGGEDWVKKGTLPLTNFNFSSATLKATPSRAGHLWFNHPSSGLDRSENSGATWVKIDNTVKAKSFAIGKSKTDNGYPTIYMVGITIADSEEAVYRSTDQGNSWVKINNEASLFLLSNPRYMAADRSVFGKIYIGIGGLGVWQGQIEENTLSLDQNNLEEIHVVYPNPTTQLLYIESTSMDRNANVVIVNMMGQLVEDFSMQQMDNGLRLNVSNLAPGIYFVNVSTGNAKKSNYRFIKQ